MHLSLNCIASRSVYRLHLVTTQHNQEIMPTKVSDNAIYFQHITQTMPLGWNLIKCVSLYLLDDCHPYNLLTFGYQWVLFRINEYIKISMQCIIWSKQSWPNLLGNPSILSFM